MVVFYSIAVQDSIVLDWSQVSILFPNEEKGGSIGRLGGANIIALSLFMKELIKSTVLMPWHGVNLAVDRAWGAWEKVNGMIPFSGGRESSGGLFTKYLLVTKVFSRYELFKLGFSFVSCLLGKASGCGCFAYNGIKGVIRVS